jgi:hypothetical protein
MLEEVCNGNMITASGVQKMLLPNLSSYIHSGIVVTSAEEVIPFGGGGDRSVTVVIWFEGDSTT